MDEKQAAQALATVREHQDRTRWAARRPWWVYLAMFVLAAAVGAANDFVDLFGAKLIAVLVVALLVIVYAARLVSRSSVLGRVRGVERRVVFDPRVFGAVFVVICLVMALAVRYGGPLAATVAGVVGLPGYPNTVGGVLVAAVLTAVFALADLVFTRASRRADR